MIAASKRLLFIFVFIHFQATWLSLRVRSELRITHRTLIELFLLLIFLSLAIDFGRWMTRTPGAMNDYSKPSSKKNERKNGLCFNDDGNDLL